MTLQPLFLAAVLLAAPGPTPGGAQPEDLGIPIATPNRISYGTAWHFGPKQLDLLCWTTTAESGGDFCALDLSSGKVSIHPLRSMEAYPLVFGSDGSVYVGSTTGEVMRWNPIDDTWGPAGPPLFRFPGASLNHVRVLCEGKDGWLYAGSCYGERSRLQMKTGIVEKLPPVPEAGQWYVSAATTLPNGRVAFGFGYKCRVYVYDPILGKDVGQWLPSDWMEDGFCFNLVAGPHVLYATHFPSGRRGAFDVTTGEFIGLVPWPPATLETNPSRWVHSSGHGSAVDFYRVPGTDRIITADGSRILAFDPTVSMETVPVEPEAAIRDSSLVLALRYEVTSDCRVLTYDRTRSRVVGVVAPKMSTAERKIFSLGEGPDGCIYGGVYQSTLLFRFDPKQGLLSVAGDHHPGWSGELYSLAVRDSDLICASYTNGAMVRYNPWKPWRCEQDVMVNPSRIGFLGQHVYRPQSTCVTPSKVLFSVGPAGWGTPGGGVARCNPDTRAIDVIPLPDVPHTVLSLRTGLLLVVSDSLVRWWDESANRMLVSAPLPFVSSGACISPSDTSAIAMVTNDRRLVVVDVRNPGMLRTVKEFSLPLRSSRVMTRGSQYVVGGEDGFATVDPATGRVDHFCTEPPGIRFAWSVAGDFLYFGSGGHLMRVQLPGGTTIR
jgi:hypothetical protein